MEATIRVLTAAQASLALLEVTRLPDESSFIRSIQQNTQTKTVPPQSAQSPPQKLFAGSMQTASFVAEKTSFTDLQEVPLLPYGIAVFFEFHKVFHTEETLKV